jgi:hypothetical protein
LYAATIKAVATNVTAGSVNGTLSLQTAVNSTLADRVTIQGSNVGIGTTAPTARLNLAAGMAAAGTAPLKFTSGTNLGTAEDGAMEYSASSLYFTIGATRYVIPTNTAAGNFSNVNTISNSTGSITMTPLAGNSVILNSATVSSTPTSGALIVSGGAGISGDVNTTGNIVAGGSITAPTSIYTPQLYGASTASANIKIDGANNAAKGNVLLASVGGNVGVGTTAPSQPLTVAGVIRSEGANLGVITELELVNNTNSSGAGAGINFKNGAISIASITQSRGGATNDGNILFSTKSSTLGTFAERMRVSDLGNVGIGTTAPARLLDVAGPIHIASTVLPASPTVGDVAIDSAAAGTLKWYDGSAWASANNAKYLQGRTVSSLAPSPSQIITWNNVSSAWEPTDSPNGNPTIQTKTTDFSVLPADNHRVFMVTGLATATLPAVATVPSGFEVTIKRVTGSNVTVAGSGAETIDGSNTRVLQTNYASVRMANTGTEWIVIGGGASAAASGCTPGQQIYNSPGSYSLAVTAAMASNCTFTIIAKAGGGSTASSGGGTGGAVQFNYTASGSGTMTVLVGGKGAGTVGGYGGGGSGGIGGNGGGGGGASAVAFAGTVLSITGGGGGGTYPATGGNGGASGAGSAGVSPFAAAVGGGNNVGGAFGTNSGPNNGGAGGGGVSAGTNGVDANVTNTGGAGGSAYAGFSISGGGGGGGTTCGGRAGAGGGGGYGGGGGGSGDANGCSSFSGASGAGGGGYISGSVTGFTVTTATPASTDGQVVINWN